MKKIKYYKNNVLIDELRPPFSSVLSFLYTYKIGTAVRSLFKSHFIARLYGAYQNTQLSKAAIKKFIKKYAINMSDYHIPQQGYSSFNEFFIRRLKPNARTINADPTTITSPADGKLLVIPNISRDHIFFIKQSPFNLERFLNKKKLAQTYESGTLMVIRLAPYDYHRFHFPTDCLALQPQIINGTLESVHPLVFKSGIQPLIENERHLIELQTKNFDTIAMIPIGAMMVGKIIHTYTPNNIYKKGDEAGYFAFGGSNIALLFKKNTITPKADFIKHSLQGYETCVHMGEALNE